MNKTSRNLLAICFFLSGATSLVLEVAWAKELSFSLGNSIHATSTVIAAFMAGLGIGSVIAGRPSFARLAPIKTYALLQLLIGITGFVSIFVLRSTGPIFEFVYQDLALGPAAFLVVRFLVVFPLMALPATLMGMSLPLVVEARSRQQLGVGANAGMFYGLNTLGAVTGTYLAGFILIPALGLAKTCMAVGVADFLVGLVLLSLHFLSGFRVPWKPLSSAAHDAPSRESAMSVVRMGRSKRLFALLFLIAGFLSMVYEVAWFRLLANVLGGTVHAFTSMLGVFLIGVGLGSVLGTRLLSRSGSPFLPVAVCLFGIGIGAVSSMMLVNTLPTRYAELFWALDGGRSLGGYVLAQALIAAIVVLPTSLAMGSLFPFALRAYESLGAGSQDRRDASEIYALNTFGGICGSLAAGFVFLPRAGLAPTLMLGGGASALLAVVVLAMLMKREAIKNRIGIAAVGVGAMASMMLLVPDMNHLELHRGLFFNMPGAGNLHRLRNASRPGTAGLRLFYTREGLHGSVSITAGRSLALRLSGKPVATTEFHDRVHLALLGHLPALFARSPENVAVIGLGMGVTVGSLTTHSEIGSIEVAELEPAILEVQSYFEAVNGDPLGDPRVDLTLEDGRTHLTYSEKSYDIITSDPISPIIAGAANLYTRDFYRLAADRLERGGVFCQWWEMSRVAESTYKSVLASMREVFPHMLVFVYGFDSMIIASMEPIAIDWDEWQRRVNVPAVQEDLAFYGLGDALDVLGLLMADTELVDAYIRTSDRVNTDDNAWLEHQMPIDRYSPETNDPIPNRMARSTASGRLRAIENAVPGIPREALVEHVLRNPPTKSARVHEFLLRFVRQYVREVGEAALLPSLADWHETRNRTLKARREFVLLEREYDRALDSADTTAVETSLRKMAGFPQLTIFHEWMMIRVEFLIGQGRLDEALDLLGQLRRRSPSRSAVYRLGAEVAEELGNFAEAQRYRAQLALIPPDDSADSADFDPWAVRDQITWADELSEVSLFEDAAVHARRALELDGENATAHVSLGQALYYLDRREEALAQYRLALELGPGSSNLHARMGVILAEDGRFDEAEEHFRAALDLNPKSATVEFLWGSVLWRQGKFAEAARRFEAALEIDPSNERIRKRLNEARVRVRREAS